MTSPFLDEPRPPADEGLRALLQDLVLRVRRHRETPLQEGIDAARIVAAAWQTFTAAGLSAHFGSWREGMALPAALSRLVQSALAEDSDLSPKGTAEASLDRSPGRPADPLSRESFRLLTAWLEQGVLALRGVHPRALEILGLRLEGCTDREIAQRLGLGLRLVQHLARDLRQAWEQAPRQE